MSAREFDVDDELARSAWVRELALRIARDQSDADDLAQDAWLAALSRRTEGALPSGAWFRGVLANLARFRRRTNARRGAREQDVARPELGDDDAAAGLERLESQELVLRAVRELDEPLRAAIVQHWLEGRTPAEIAERTRTPLRTVQMRLARGLELLRMRLAGDEPSKRRWMAAWAPLLARVDSPWPWMLLMDAKLKLALAGTLAVGAFVAIAFFVSDGERRDAPSTIDAESRAAELERTAEPAPGARVEPEAPVVRVADSARANAARAETSNATRLIVHVVAKETGAPLADWRARLTPAPVPVGGWSTRRVDGPRADEHGQPRTGEDGVVEFDVEAAHAYTIDAFPEPGATSGKVDETAVPALTAGETRELVLAARTASDLVFHVRVLDVEQRAPIAGARVRARAQNSAVTTEPEKILRPHVDRELADAATDAAGIARLELRSWDRPYVEVEAAGLGRAFVSVDGGHATVATALDVLLSRAARLSGTLAGAGEGEVLVRAPSWALMPGDQRSMLVSVDTTDAWWSAKLAPDGRFAFDALPAGCTLDAEFWPVHGQPARIGEKVELAAGEERVVAWRLGGHCAVRGRVLDGAEAPVAGVALWLVPETAPMPCVFVAGHDGETVRAVELTNAAGEFTFAEVTPGKWQVGLAPDVQIRYGRPGLDVVGLSERVEIADADVVRELVLRVDRGLYVSGVVRTPDGAAPAHAYVQANDVAGRASFTENTSDGTFRVGPVLRGRYRLSATGDPHGPTPIVEVEAGAEGVVLTLTAGAAIHGRVVDASGAPPPYEIQVAASEGSRVRFTMMATTTDEKGEFTLDGLEPGAFDVVASTTGGRFGVTRGIVAKPGGTTEVEVRLDAGARLRVRCGYEKGSLLVRSDGALIHMLQPDSKAPVECALPSGRITVELVKYVQRDGAWGPETLSKESADLAPGETKELVLDAPK
ncbi:MAG: sigma-70 family RNA polymerase sigma factor [Planctomycetota bacterium]